MPNYSVQSVQSRRKIKRREEDLQGGKSISSDDLWTKVLLVTQAKRGRDRKTGNEREKERERETERDKYI